MVQQHLPPQNDDHSDPAAFWFARMNGGVAPTAQDEADFRHWLQEDPDNGRAFRSCQEAWRVLELDAGEPEILALRAEALGGASSGLNRRRAIFGLGSGAAAACVAGIWVTIAASPAKALIATKAGERLTATLPDGSQVTLAPLSRLRLDFARDRRAATLEEGQAYFHVLPDAQRPFALRSGDSVLTTIEGRFQAAVQDKGAQVTLEQGVLNITERGSDSPPRKIFSGQRVELGAGPVEVAAADVEADTAWRLGRLVVRDRPLREVVQAFNRYSADRIAIEDAIAGERRISGSFRYDGAAEFVSALSTGFDLAVERRADGIWRIQSREASEKL